MELKEEWKYGPDEGYEEEHYDRKLIILPGCCETSRKALRPFLCTTDSYNTESGVQWTIPHVDYEYIRTFVSTHESWTEKDGDTTVYHSRDRGYEESKSPVKFCPYCGTKMPEIRLKDSPPVPIREITDGGYYCDTCEERLIGCGCWPTEAKFEVVKE